MNWSGPAASQSEGTEGVVFECGLQVPTGCTMTLVTDHKDVWGVLGRGWVAWAVMATLEPTGPQLFTT